MTKPWEFIDFKCKKDVYRYSEKLSLDKKKIKILAWQEKTKHEVQTGKELAKNMENGNLYIPHVCIWKFSTPGRFPYLSYSSLLHFCVLFLYCHPNMQNRGFHQPVTHLKTFSMLSFDLLFQSLSILSLRIFSTGSQLHSVQHLLFSNLS